MKQSIFPIPEIFPKTKINCDEVVVRKNLKTGFLNSSGELIHVELEDYYILDGSEHMLVFEVNFDTKTIRQIEATGPNSSNVVIDHGKLIVINGKLFARYENPDYDTTKYGDLTFVRSEIQAAYSEYIIDLGA